MTTTKAETSSRHGDPRTKATAAIAHSILVLAEQVAVARVLMVSDAASQRPNGETTPQA